MVALASSENADWMSDVSLQTKAFDGLRSPIILKPTYMLYTHLSTGCKTSSGADETLFVSLYACQQNSGSFVL